MADETGHRVGHAFPMQLAVPEGALHRDAPFLDDRVEVLFDDRGSSCPCCHAEFAPAIGSAEQLGKHFLDRFELAANNRELLWPRFDRLISSLVPGNLLATAAMNQMVSEFVDTAMGVLGGM